MSKLAFRSFVCCVLLLAVAAGAQTRSSTPKKTAPAKTSVPADDEQPGINPKVAKAEDFLAKGNFPAAEPLLKEAVAAHPRDFRAWYDLGFLYQATKREPEAVAAYRHAVEVNPKLFEATLQLGLLLHRTGDPKAKDVLAKALTLTPESKDKQKLGVEWSAVGMALADLKDFPGAIQAFQIAKQNAPDDPDTRQQLALAYDESGNVDAALNELRGVFTPAALGLFATISEKHNRLGEAEHYLRSYLAAHPQSGEVHWSLADVLLRQERFPEAQQELREAIKLGVKSGNPAVQLAPLDLQLKDYAEAETLYRQLIAGGQAQNDAQLHYGLGQALMRQKKFAEAQQEFMRAVQLKPDFGEAYGDLAFTASANQNYELTIKALEARSRSLPELPATLFLRATAWDHLHQPKPAAEYYHKFLDVADGKFPDQEWQARHRLIAIEPKKK